MADFLTGLTKTLEKSGYDVGESPPPRWWISTGNFVVNKIISKHFNRGIPQGRLTAVVGPSQAGKSFVVCNMMREAQKDGCIVVALDSENALDDDFVTAIGVDVKHNYQHVHVDTIPDMTSVTSTVIKGYKEEYGNADDAPRLLMVIDSLDMLVTATEKENYDKRGEVKGDQGQKNKQLKTVLRQLVHAIKHLNIAIVVTDQVYSNQDLLNGEGKWIVKDAIKYSLSQILMVTKLNLKDDKTDKRLVTGFKMKCDGYKTRFAQPRQTVTIEVPYSTGMDPYTGLLGVAKEIGIVKQAGSWYTYNEQKFQSKNFDQYADAVLIDCEKTTVDFLEASLEDYIEDEGKDRKTRKNKIVDKLSD